MADNVLTDWHWRWDVIFGPGIFATLYIRGWLRLREIGGEAKLSQLGFYAIALISIGVALSVTHRRTGLLPAHRPYGAARAADHACAAIYPAG